jgi:hypothetical protein
MELMYIFKTRNFLIKVESEINRQSGFSLAGMTLFLEEKLIKETNKMYTNI